MKKYLALVLAVLMLIAAFAGCANGKKEEQKEGTKAYGTFHDYSTSIASTMNHLTSSDTAVSTAVTMCAAALYTYELNEAKDGWEYQGKLASDFPKQVDEEGKLWEIKLRKDYTWANGDLITVDDVIYTFQQYADPNQVNLQAALLTQSSYGSIKNLYEYSLGMVESWEEVGVKKIDDFTMQVEMTAPTVMLNVLRLVDKQLVYKPLYEAGMSSDRSYTDYGTSVDTFMSGGPYILVEWIPDAKMVFERNPNYVLSDLVKVERYEIRAVPDQNTAMQLFENGEVDYVDVPYTSWEQYEDDPRFYEYFGDSLMYLLINLGNPNQGGILGNINMREAMYYGIDRVAIADTLGVYPASRLVRKAVIANPTTGGAFVDVPADYLDDPYTIYDTAKANEYLTKAFEECKQTAVSFSVLIGETATHIRGAGEIMQKQFESVFGGKVNIELKFLPANQVYSLRRWNPDNPTAYDLSFGSVVPDASDPRTTFSYYRSDYNPPRFCYNNPEFDAIYDGAMNLDLEKDNDTVVKACQEMEKMILDDLVIVPVYERPNKVLFQEWIDLPANGYIVGYGFGLMYATVNPH